MAHLLICSGPGVHAIGVCAWRAPLFTSHMCMAHLLICSGPEVHAIGVCVCVARPMCMAHLLICSGPEVCTHVFGTPLYMFLNPTALHSRRWLRRVRQPFPPNLHRPFHPPRLVHQPMHDQRLSFRHRHRPPRRHHLRLQSYPHLRLPRQRRGDGVPERRGPQYPKARPDTTPVLLHH